MLIRLGSNLIFRTSFAAVRQDPLQPLLTIAAFGLLFVSAGLLSDQIVSLGAGYLAEVSRFVERLR